jgi:hypothetical protein
MKDELTHKPGVSALALLVVASIGVAGCGDHVGGKEAATPAKFAITATEAGKQLRLAIPKSVHAGLVTIELTNRGQAFHEAQLIRLEPGHTPADALKVIVAEGAPSPGWVDPCSRRHRPRTAGRQALGNTAVAVGQLHRL